MRNNGCLQQTGARKMSINMDELGNTPAVDLLKPDYALNKVSNPVSQTKEEPPVIESKVQEETLELSSKYSSVAEQQINIEIYQNDFNQKANDKENLAKVEDSLTAIKTAANDQEIEEEKYQKIKEEQFKEIEKTAQNIANFKTEDLKLDKKSDDKEKIAEDIDKALKDIDTKKRQLEADMDSLIDRGSHLVRIKLQNKTAEASEPVNEPEPVQTPDAEKTNKDIIKDPVKAVDIQINNLDGNLLLAMLSVTRGR